MASAVKPLDTMNTEGFEMPMASDHLAKEDTAAAMKGSASKHKNDRPARTNVSLKLPTGNPAKVGPTSARPPISSRAASMPQSRAAAGGKNKIEPKASTSKTLLVSGPSSHAKIMEKKMAARAKAARENESGASTNGPAERSGGASKVPPASKAVPKGKNPALTKPNTTSVPKRPTSALAKLPPVRPERTQSKLSSQRPDTAPPSSHPTPIAGAVRKQAGPRVPNERQTPGRPGIVQTGTRAGKPPAGSNFPPQPKRTSSELNKTTNTQRPTKPKPVRVSPSAAEQKKPERLKGQVAKLPVKSTPRLQPAPSTYKLPASHPLPQSTKSSKRNMEKQPLPNKGTSPSRKSLSASDIGKRAGQSGIGASPVRSPLKVVSVEAQNEDVAGKNPQNYLSAERVSSPQGAPHHGDVTPDYSTVEEDKLEMERVEANSFELAEREPAASEGTVEKPGRLNEGDLNYGQTAEADLISNEIQKDTSVVEVCGTNVTGVDFGPVEGTQINVGAKVASINGDLLECDVLEPGDLNPVKTDQIVDENVASVNRQLELTKDLQEQALPSSSPSSEQGSPHCAGVVSPVEYISVLNEGSIDTVPVLENLAALQEPTLGSCLDDESSPESDRKVSKAEKVKLAMYEYSEEADTEDSPNELGPETLQSPEIQDLVSEPVNPLETMQISCQMEGPVLETMQISCKMEGPVGNWPFEGKLSISPEDSHEDQGVSKSSTLSGPDLAGKSSSTTSTPEELKDYNSSSGVESKSDEKLESADLFIPQTDLSPLDDLMDQDLGIHLERGDDETETLAADDLHGDPPTEPMVSSEDEDHSEDKCPGVMREPVQCELEGIDNPVFEDKTATDSNSEEQSHTAASRFKPLILHALDESEELSTAETPCSLDSSYVAPQNCTLSRAGSPEDPAHDQIPVTIGVDSCGPDVSLSTPSPLLPPDESSRDVISEECLTLHCVSDSTQEKPVSDQSMSCIVDVPVSGYPMECLDGNLANLQELNDPLTDANEGHTQQLYHQAGEQNDSVLTVLSTVTGLLNNEDDQTLQAPACVPWMNPLLPPILSTIYEVETTEEARLEDGIVKEGLGEPPDWQRLELLDDPSDKVLHLQIEPVEVVQQLISQTLLLSGDGVKLQSKVMVDQAELSKWTDLISPLDDSTASVTSVTSFSPEDISSSQGEWTVVELETHH